MSGFPTHAQNKTAFERLSNGIQTLFYFAKKYSKSLCQLMENHYLYRKKDKVYPVRYAAILSKSMIIFSFIFAVSRFHDAVSSPLSYSG